MSEIKRPVINPLKAHVGSGLIHVDQTTRQPIVFVCPNPECAETRDGLFEFQSDYPECPKCGSTPPAVQKRALIHYMVPAKDGPITGHKGLKYKLCCDPTRWMLATLTNGESATGVPTVVNCPGCMTSPEFLQILSQIQRRFRR